MKEKGKTKGAVISIWLDQDTEAEIKRLAGGIGVSPSTFCRNLVVVGLQESRAMEKVGLLQAVSYLQDLRERYRKRIEEESQRIREEFAEHSPA